MLSCELSSSDLGEIKHFGFATSDSTADLREHEQISEETTILTRIHKSPNFNNDLSSPLIILQEEMSKNDVSSQGNVLCKRSLVIDKEEFEPFGKTMRLEQNLIAKPSPTMLKPDEDEIIKDQLGQFTDGSNEGFIDYSDFLDADQYFTDFSQPYPPYIEFS